MHPVGWLLDVDALGHALTCIEDTEGALYLLVAGIILWLVGREWLSRSPGRSR